MNANLSLSRQQIKSVALPSEHGSWGFLLEPLLLGLFVTGSPEALLLSLAVLCAFLVHQPLKLALKDRLKGRRSPRTVWAERFAAVYGLLALLLLGIVSFTAGVQFFAPLVLALPLLLVQVWYDARNQSRALTPELCGALALGSTASAIAILGGWSFGAALPLWLVVGSRSIPSILYVRARLKLEHGKPIRPYPVWIAHAASLVLVGALAAAGILPASVIIAFVLLLARAWHGLSKYRKPRPAKQIGILEMVYGFAVVLLTSIGYAVG